MSYARDSAFTEQFTLADRASADARADFIGKTYLHLAGAIMIFAGLSAVMLKTGFAIQLVNALGSVGGQWGMLLLVGAFILVSFVADRWARTATSLPLQYAGLGLYVVAEAVIFAPLLFVASRIDPSIIPTAGMLTVVMFGGLSMVVFMTRKDFSFLAPILSIASFAALGLIVCSMLFGFSLGIVFTVAMIAVACGYILYDTSNILHQYRIGQHVAASLALFASVAMLFYYVIRLVMALSDRR